MPQIAENIAQIFLRNGARPRSINEIVDEYNIMYNPLPPVNYNAIYGAISREWEQDKYALYWNDDHPPRIQFEIGYYGISGV